MLISAGNAISRYALNISSNAWLEIQWYLFSAVFLFCAGYTLLHNEHVRIDVVYRAPVAARARPGSTSSARFSSCCRWRSRSCGCPGRCSSTPPEHSEISANAGGLIVWPARLMLPVGFFLLILQGISELIKRIAFLQGLIPDPAEKDEGPTDEELLADELRKERGELA